MLESIKTFYIKKKKKNISAKFFGASQNSREGNRERMLSRVIGNGMNRGRKSRITWGIIYV